MLKGIDVSKWNTLDDVNKHIDECDFVIIRAGFGKNNKDKMFIKHYNRWACIKNKPYGVYWFSYALSVEDARNEARYCWDTVIMKNSLNNPTYPIYFDLEYDSQAYFRKKMGRNMTKEEVIKFTMAFCNEIEILGGYAGYYCNKDYYNRYYKDLTQYTCWLADYSNKSFNNRSSNIHMIQYTSKPIDKDVCKINFPSIIQKKHLNGW